MRSQGQVRFIKISSRMQMTAAAVALAVILVWAVSMAVMAISQFASQANRLALLEREAKVESAESRVAAYRHDLDGVVSDLDHRTKFLEGALASIPDDVLATEAPSSSTSEAAATVEKVSQAVPEAGALAMIEARQLAMVERLTRFADQRAQRAVEAIRELGLNPDRILASASVGQGGPFEFLSSEGDGELDPRFERLGLSLARMEALERGLESIPQVMPADIRSISSGFGYRRDPFNGRAAMHAGLDFRGNYGAPIHAAAAGKVTFVGWKNGYGKAVEVSHGNGLMTRYAHMSAWNAKVGQRVAPGDIIGKIGSTGRSTGPHLHFEVRINNRAVNPRTFLEKAPHVLEEARGSPADDSAG